MPDIKNPDEARLVATLAQDLFRRIAFDSKATTLDGLIGDVQRIERFVQVPAGFKQMVASIARERGVRVPATFVHEAAYRSSARDGEAWEKLTSRLDSIRALDELISRISKLTGLRLTSKTFQELALEVEAVKDTLGIPDTFVQEVKRIAPLRTTRIVPISEPPRLPEAEAATPPAPAPRSLPEVQSKRFVSAPVQAPAPKVLPRMPRAPEKPVTVGPPKDIKAESELHEALLDLACSAGLSGVGKGGPARLYARLKKVAGASLYVARKLALVEERFKTEIEALPPASIPPSIPLPAPSGQSGESEKTDTSPEEPNLPLFVQQFNVSVLGLDWTDQAINGALINSEAGLLMEPFGSAIVGRGRTIDLGAKAFPGMSAFFMRDPVSGISAAGKFPGDEDLVLASKRIARQKRELRGGYLGKVADKNRLLDIVGRLEKGELSPFEYEFGRIAAEFTKLEIPLERLHVSAMFFAGLPEETSFGQMPAPLFSVLTAMNAAGFVPSSLALYRAPSSACGPIVLDAAHGRVLIDGTEHMRLNAAHEQFLPELDLLMIGALSALRDARVNEPILDAFRHYLLPVAAGLWWQNRTTMRDHLRDVARKAKEDGDSEMLGTYKQWHQEVPLLTASGSAAGGKAGSAPSHASGSDTNGAAALSASADAFALRTAGIAASIVSAGVAIAP